ncbi:MAG: cbb3-type cytochrome c oxidase N-terminal domain-containing protein [Balneolaceae bacterium]
MKVFDDEKDKLLDHEYDGIRELDNHMPVWWLWLFYFTIAFGIGYFLYYEVLDWGADQHEEYDMEIAAAEAIYGSPDNRPDESYEWVFSTDEADIAAGKAIFDKPAQLCFTCHGQNAQGLVGPDLTDEYWLHGCGPKDIAMSIIDGYPDRGMLAYGGGAKLSNDEVQQLVSYIVSLQGSNPPDAKAPDTSRAERCTPDLAAEL